ncbi:MAG: hypothetical protein MUF61_00305 [archaeon]|jgi:large subunit ribosomal protein L44e|nr:hypothetical protein [archaeon]
MKLPKETRRYCPYCRKHTQQAISIAKQRARSSTHPLSRGGKSRTNARGLTTGYGNKGRYSKMAVKSRKMKTKVTKRLTVLYKCKICGKSKGMKTAIRSGRIEVGEKVSK